MNVEQVINGMADKIETLENKVKELEKKPLQAYYILAKKTNDKIETLENISWARENWLNKHTKEIETLENDVKALYKLDRSNENAIIKQSKEINAVIKSMLSTNQETTETIKLNDKCDDLEAKYYKLLQAIDEIRKDGETITIKELRRFKDWDELNESIKDDCAEYEAEQMMIDENNKLNEEE